MDSIEVINSSISLVQKCIGNKSDSNYSNVADDFLPIGPQTLKDHKLDWERVYRVVIERLFQLSMGGCNREELRDKILNDIRNSRDTRELVDVIDELYFFNDEIRNITPLAYLVSNQDSLSARTRTMINIVKGLLCSPLKEEFNYCGNNPLDGLLIDKIFKLCKKTLDLDAHETYLPFLAELFSQDLRVLASKPSYFLSELESFIKLYTFIYLSQLTIQVCIPNNRYKFPSSKSLYFILETEKASKERHECNQYGYDYLFSNTRGIAYSLFPTLGYLSRISSTPIWKMVSQQTELFIKKVNEFNNDLASLFGESYKISDSLEDTINSGIAFQNQMFHESLANSKKGSRKTANKKVVDIFEKVFSAGFITDRKAAGKYFSLSTSSLLLLTNLIINASKDDKMLIDDVIYGFNERGIYLDLKSKKALLKIYESVGNIEKLSDSGDAVYVKATI